MDTCQISEQKKVKNLCTSIQGLERNEEIREVGLLLRGFVFVAYYTLSR